MSDLEMEKVGKIVKLALEEDIASGDITTEAIIPAGTKANAVLVSHEECVLCGLDVAEAVFRELDPGMEFVRKAEDGDEVKPDQVLLEVTGDARALLTGERTALNFLQRLSGIATKAHGLAERIKDKDVKLLDTRKTTPGLRVLEKYAVRTGGGSNHRFGLYDAILIKDNHITLVDLDEAVREAGKTGKKVEVEACDMEEVDLALKAGADIIMLDNMSIEDIEKAVKVIDKHALIEVSGGVNGKDIETIAGLDVDWISVGRLTHSVRSVDISMDVKEGV